MPPKLDYDQIAAWIHGHYMKTRPEAVLPEFAGLPEFLKADNRDAALRMGQVLAMAGLRIDRRTTPDWPTTDQEAIRSLIKENIELLAEAEHDGWVESRLRNGWVLGSRKNFANREHHLLVGYSLFPQQIEKKQQVAGPDPKKDGTLMTLAEEVDDAKQKDRDSVLNYVNIIARTDYRIVPAE